MSLNDEIEESSKRIEVRQSEITIEIGKLSEQINKFTVWAWIFVGFGALLGVFSFIYFLCRNTDPGFGLNLLGDFMAGTVASIWSLSGLFFIYVAFLGQKQQLLNQQLEIMYSQLEVKYTRLELSEQKLEMRAQNETLLNQKFENTFFQLLTLFNSIVNSMDLRRSDSKTAVISQGRDCFEIFYRRLKSQSPNGNSLTEGFLFDSANIDDTLLAPITAPYQKANILVRKVPSPNVFLSYRKA
jgi:hypothetical protein